MEGDLGTTLNNQTWMPINTPETFPQAGAVDAAKNDSLVKASKQTGSAKSVLGTDGYSEYIE